MVAGTRQDVSRVSTVLKIEDFDAIVFDFDGVILESAARKGEAFVELFAEFPEHRSAILEHHLENLGVSRFEKFEWIYRHLFKRPLTEGERRKLGRRYSNLVFEATLASPFVPGTPELLDSLTARIPLFVASATPTEELHRIIEARSLGKFFRGVYGSPPEKETVLRNILERTSSPAYRVLMFGDGLSDYLAASSVGCRFIARVDPSAPDQSWPNDVPRVTNMAEISVS